MQIYLHKNDQQLGPFTEAEIKAQLASGAISLQDHVWWEGQANWIPLGESPLVAAGTAAPGIPAMSPATSPTEIPQPTSKLAVWALVCGCLGLFLSLLASIPAIILGHLSMSQIKKNPGMRGHGMALAGLILGYICTILLPLISIVAISVLIALGNQVKDTFKTINAQENAAQATNGADQSATPPDQSTNAPDQTAPAPASTNTSDQSARSPDSSATVPPPSTSAADGGTNTAPMSQ
jgi:hypothetical protein